MALEIEILTSSKGSNPGGKCSIGVNNRPPFLYYVKHCHSASGKHPFNPQNQPFFEAITFEMARTLGLHVPDFYVLLNPERGLEFKHSSDIKPNLHPDKKCYFASRIIAQPSIRDDNPDLVRVIDEERIHRDLLDVADIEGIGQNYSFFENGDEPPRVFYLDLGCSFVHSKEGKLFIQGRHQKALEGCLRDKHYLKELSHYAVISRDDKIIVPLKELAFSSRTMTVPAIDPRLREPFTRVRVSDYLSEEELHAIECILTAQMRDSVRKYKSSPYLIKD
ncbi:MAG: hypothetical protein NT076_01090 [Candidatus Pacearchaeota archaeon]|nr:hypothetical protein [Candidatus Pacearchaeota archaeon]